MSILERARKYRAIIESAMALTDDKAASEAPVLFPFLKEDGALVPAGTRINWNGVVKRAAVDLWDTADNNPDNVPELWEELKYKDGIRIIPTEITVTSAFSEGELGYWEEDESIYKSKVNGNVFTPVQYPDNWELQESGV